MNTIAKKRVGVIFGTLAFLVFVALVVCLPRTSYAAALGTESPNVYCTYTDSNGKQYDGDKLPAGTYDVSFYLGALPSYRLCRLHQPILRMYRCRVSLRLFFLMRSEERRVGKECRL